MAKISTYPDAPTPYVGTESAIGTGADGVTTYNLVTGAIVALAGSSTSRVVTTLAALRAITTIGSGAIVVQSFARPGDGGGGVFVYDASDTTTPDNVGTIIAPTAILPGRWYRQYSGPLDIRWFGGVADWFGAGPIATDNSPALTAAIASLTVGTGNNVGGPHIKYPGAPLGYLHNSTQFFQKTVIIEGDSPGMPGAYPTTLVFPPALGAPAFKFERYNTLNNQIISPTQSGADGSIVRNLQLFTVNFGTFDGVSHGIDTRCRIKVENVQISGFAGHGLQILANSGGSGATQGNADEWAVTTYNALGNMGHAFVVQGSDANGGLSQGIGVQSSGLGGLVDLTFLGNTHVAPHIDSCDSLQQDLVTHGGNGYLLISAVVGIGASTTPGTNNTIWYNLGASSAHPAWSSGGTYNIGCAIFSSNANARSSFVGPYIEGGLFVHVLPPSILYGGSTQTAATSFTSWLYNSSGIGSFLTTTQGFGGLDFLPAGSPVGTTQYSYVAPGGLNMSSSFGVWNVGVSNAGGGNDIIIGNNLWSPTVLTITGNETQETFGTGAPAPGVLAAPVLAVGVFGTQRMIRNGTAASYSAFAGASGQGEKYFIIDAAPGAPFGYQCTTAGTNPTGPGTGTAVWKVMGTLAS